MFLVSDAAAQAVHDAYDRGGREAAKQALISEFRGLEGSGADQTLSVILSWPRATLRPPADPIPFQRTTRVKQMR